MKKTSFTIADDRKTLIVERTFDAPKDKVWNAYADKNTLARWWGPKGWETQIKHLDFKTGGSWLYGMTCKDKQQADWYGKTSWGKMVFEEVTPKDSFIYTDIFCDENGTPVEGLPSSRTVLTLTEQGGKTTILSKTAYDTAEALAQVLEMGMEEGYSQTMDNLETILAA